jgi:hypothetical protein
MARPSCSARSTAATISSRWSCQLRASSAQSGSPGGPWPMRASSSRTGPAPQGTKDSRVTVPARSAGSAVRCRSATNRPRATHCRSVNPRSGAGTPSIHGYTNRVKSPSGRHGSPWVAGTAATTCSRPWSRRNAGTRTVAGSTGPRRTFRCQGVPSSATARKDQALESSPTGRNWTAAAATPTRWPSGRGRAVAAAPASARHLIGHWTSVSRSSGATWRGSLR